MRRMPFNLKEKGAAEKQHSGLKKKKEGEEPRSVLDQRRSPSDGDSGEGSIEVAAVSGNPLQKWQDTTSPSGGGGGADWASELHDMPLEIGVAGGGEDWESMLRAEEPPPPPPPSAVDVSRGQQDQSFLTWILGDVEQQHNHHHNLSVSDFSGGGGGGGFGLVEPEFGFGFAGGGFPLLSSGGDLISASSPLPPLKNHHLFGNNTQNSVFPSSFPVSTLPNNTTTHNFSSLPPSMVLQEPLDEKPHLFGLLNHHHHHHQSHVPQNNHNNPSFFPPLNNPYSQLEQQPQGHPFHSMADQVGPKVPFPNPRQDFSLRRHHPQPQPQPQQQTFDVYQRPTKVKIVDHHHQQQQQVLVDQLFKAAELVDGRNFVNAREILARLNHQLSPHGKPLMRTAFYFKEALDAIVGTNSTMPRPKTPASHLDVVYKLNAYKNFSEISPVIQFTNFTCIQALLEEFSGCDHIHIVDFNIGFGGQWSSFMQELSQRRCSSAAESVPSLKITAFVVPSSHHQLELVLTRENLSHFARDLNISFEFNILNIESFDPSVVLGMSNGYNEAIAVNMPVGFPVGILHLVKQLSPKIVVSVDHNCDRSDLSFSQHFLNALHSYTIMLESMDAAGANQEVSNKIERYLMQPKIENIISGRYNSADKTLPWRTQFTSAGFIPVPFSNFTEAQAECLLKRIQLQGFHVEKRQSSLLLFWQLGELVSVSAWKC